VDFSKVLMRINLNWWLFGESFDSDKENKNRFYRGFCVGSCSGGFPNVVLSFFFFAKTPRQHHHLSFSTEPVVQIPFSGFPTLGLGRAVSVSVDNWFPKRESDSPPVLPLSLDVEHKNLSVGIANLVQVFTTLQIRIREEPGVLWLSMCLQFSFCQFSPLRRTVTVWQPSASAAQGLSLSLSLCLKFRATGTDDCYCCWDSLTSSPGCPLFSFTLDWNNL